MRAEFGFDHSPLIEKLLIEHVILNWLHFHRIQYVYEIVISESFSLKVAQHWERCISSAQRRYLRAIESLARVRRIGGRPNIHLNIAQNQVNRSS